MNDSEFNANELIGEEIIDGGGNSVSQTGPAAGTIVFPGQFRRTASAFCPACEKPVQLLSFSRAADMFNTDSQDINFLAKRGDLHRIHNRRGELMICSISLFDCFDTRETRLLDSHFEIEMQKSFEANLGSQT